VAHGEFVEWLAVVFPFLVDSGGFRFGFFFFFFVLRCYKHIM
jgi:hypothetical protein